MADEFRHKDAVAGRITENEFENINQHIFNSQAKGDMMIASSATQLSRLGITNARILVSSGGLFAWSNTLPAFALGGKLTGGAQEIEGSAFDINGGTMSGVTLDGALALGGQSLDAGATSLVVITTGGNPNGIEVQGSLAAGGPALQFKWLDTTPPLNAVVGAWDIKGYDGNVAPAVLRYGLIRIEATNVTDTAEEGSLMFYLAAAGAADNLAMTVSGPGLLSCDLAGAGTALPTLFDEYDDALILREGFSGRAMEKLEAVGIISRKNTGSGWMLNFQPMMYLLAGGIYQNRARIDSLVDALVSEFPQVAEKLAVKNLLALT